MSKLTIDTALSQQSLDPTTEQAKAAVVRKVAARTLMIRENLRLKSGAGGHGGRSPEALTLANAIELVLSQTAADPATDLAKEQLSREIHRLRSGSGGHGGRSLEAVTLALAIECVLSQGS